MIADADRGGFPEDDRHEILAQVGARKNGEERAGPILFHLDGGEVHLERAGRVQLVHDRPEQLGVHIVDLALEHHNLLRL